MWLGKKKKKVSFLLVFWKQRGIPRLDYDYGVSTTQGTFLWQIQKLSDIKASNIKNNFVYFLGQTDLYRINFNRSQRPEIDRDRTQLKNCHDREKHVNLNQKDLHSVQCTSFFMQQVVKHLVWKLQFRNTIFTNKHWNTNIRYTKFYLLQIHVTQPIYNHVYSNWYEAVEQERVHKYCNVLFALVLNQLIFTDCLKYVKVEPGVEVKIKVIP